MLLNPTAETSFEQGRNSPPTLVVFRVWGDTNGKKGLIFVTFPLHEAVKQNNAYMTSKLLLFGADPTLKDTWGRTAYDYAKGKATHDQILKAESSTELWWNVTSQHE